MLYSTLGAAMVMMAVLQVVSATANPLISSKNEPLDKNEAPIPGYAIKDITWQLQTRTGSTVNITGTVQQVINYTQKNHNNIIPFNLNKTTSPSKSNLERPRDMEHYTVAKHTCSEDGFSVARTDAIKAGIKHLKGVPGKPVNGPGPNECGRVSCSWKSAIWWCNMDTESKSLESFRAIADGAQFILNNCPFHPILFSALGGWGVEGSVTMKDGWTVVVRGDHESC